MRCFYVITIVLVFEIQLTTQYIHAVMENRAQENQYSYNMLEMPKTPIRNLSSSKQLYVNSIPNILDTPGYSGFLPHIFR